MCSSEGVRCPDSLLEGDGARELRGEIEAAYLVHITDEDAKGLPQME